MHAIRTQAETFEHDKKISLQHQTPVKMNLAEMFVHALFFAIFQQLLG